MSKRVGGISKGNWLKCFSFRINIALIFSWIDNYLKVTNRDKSCECEGMLSTSCCWEAASQPMISCGKQVKMMMMMMNDHQEIYPTAGFELMGAGG